VETLRGQPALIRATKRGIHFVGVPLPIAKVRPELVGHWIACGDAALALEAEFGTEALVSEREIRVLERDAGRRVASAVVGERPEGSEILHRPDLAVRSDGHWLAVEVELTPKAPERLEAIVRAWRRARWVAGVRYYVSPGATSQGLARAVRATHSEARIEVLEIGDGVVVDGGRTPVGRRVDRSLARDVGASCLGGVR
jgi:hypothetical protein